MPVQDIDLSPIMDTTPLQFGMSSVAYETPALTANKTVS